MPPQHEEILRDWPDVTRQSCKRVIEKHGPPDEVTESMFIWHDRAPWKRIEVSREPVRHDWPMEHRDSVFCAIDYAVPPDRVSALALFDGSIIVERTKGEMGARCGGEEANFLALNLAHEIVTGRRTVMTAREVYAENMQRKQEQDMGPYMQRLLFTPPDAKTADPDVATLDEKGQRIRREDEVLAAAQRP
jgi:hypothetical protein